MKTRICFGIAVSALIVATRTDADFAPESIDGMVLRTTSALIGTDRTAHQDTCLFYADGSYSQLFSRTYYFLGHPAYVLGGSGGAIKMYTYAKTSANTATITYHSGTGSTRVLNFSSPTGGGQTEGSFTYYFSLTKMLSVESAPAMNISLRGEVRPNRPLIGGFVVPPSGSSSSGSWRPGWYAGTDREVLIRVVGPSLAQFEVEDLCADPDFRLFRDGQPFQQAEFLSEDHYSDWWGTYIREDGREVIITPVSAFEKIFELVGAFPLLEGSKDAAQVERLPPGAYTVVAEAEEGDPGGEVLIEVYFLP
ncbi:MAG: hypothetical protein R3F07_15565 [Opitutaceae bacterium]